MAMETEELEPVRREVEPRQLALIAGAVIVLLLLIWFFFLRSSGQPKTAVSRTVDCPCWMAWIMARSPALSPAWPRAPVMPP